MSPKTPPIQQNSPKISARESPQISPINRNVPFPRLSSDSNREVKRGRGGNRRGDNEVTPPPVLSTTSLSSLLDNHPSTAILQKVGADPSDKLELSASLKLKSVDLDLSEALKLGQSIDLSQDVYKLVGATINSLQTDERK
jgi:hypothetical protein